VIGQSDKSAGTPAADPVTSEDLRATIMHTLFDVGQLRIDPSVPRDISQVITAGAPIKQLV
jgi:hypothetical protein